MKVLITGDRGFIGTNLTRWIRETTSWEVLDPEDRTFESKYDRGNSVDVNNPIELEKAITQAELVIHLAARKGNWYCEEDVKDTIVTNTYGTYNVAYLCAKHKVPMIHFGTTAYYDTGHEMPARSYGEDTPAKPRTAYGVTKLAGEQLLPLIQGLNYFVIRPVFAYGNVGALAASRSESWPDVVVNEIQARRTMPLQTDLGGEFIKDYTHILDVCTATLRLAQLFLAGKIPTGEVIQIGAGGNYKFAEIMAAFDAPFEIRYDPARDYKGHQPHDYSTLKKYLPEFKPKYDVLEYAENMSLFLK